MICEFWQNFSWNHYFLLEHFFSEKGCTYRRTLNRWFIAKREISSSSSVCVVLKTVLKSCKWIFPSSSAVILSISSSLCVFDWRLFKICTKKYNFLTKLPQQRFGEQWFMQHSTLGEGSLYGWSPVYQDWFWADKKISGYLDVVKQLNPSL